MVWNLIFRYRFQCIIDEPWGICGNLRKWGNTWVSSEHGRYKEKMWCSKSWKSRGRFWSFNVGCGCVILIHFILIFQWQNSPGDHSSYVTSNLFSWLISWHWRFMGMEGRERKTLYNWQSDAICCKRIYIVLCPSRHVQSNYWIQAQ